MFDRGVFSMPFTNFERAARRLIVSAAFAGFVLAIAPAASAGPQDVSVTVQLTTPLSAASLRKGDQIAAQVASPSSFKGDLIHGRVTHVTSSRGQSLVEFSFDTLTHAGVAVAVDASVQGVSNSKGQPGVDEQ